MRGRLTYANVMSSIAVFVVLSGVAWAATLPRNSVGTKQLKKNAVTSEKVADGSVKTGDLARGARPVAGPAGSAGPAGAQGAKGDTGPAGPKGDTGAPPCEHLMCPNTDLAGYAEIAVGAAVYPRLSAFKAVCEGQDCTFYVAKKPDRNIEFNAWYELYALGDPNARRSLTITVYDENDVAYLKYHAADAVPVAMVHERNRLQFRFATSFLQRISV